MQNFVNDFGLFFTMLFGAIKEFFNWYFSTIIGEITLFILVIGIFFFVVNLIVDLKD